MKIPWNKGNKLLAVKKAPQTLVCRIKIKERKEPPLKIRGVGIWLKVQQGEVQSEDCPCVFP